VADALDCAHQQGLLHRDVKPSNILLAQSNTKFSRALLADFGIARMVKDTAGLTATDMTVGTVAYAAPEQLMGQALDGGADQYALAATAFHLLTGQQLFQHDNPAVVISNHLTASPPSIGDRIPELSGLGFAFDRALAKAPADRFDSCSEFAEAMAHGLSDAAQGIGASDATIAAPASGRQSKHAKQDDGRSRRLRLGLVAAGVAAVLIGGAIAAGVVIANREEPTAQRAPAPPAASTPAMPVVRIGADCDPLGSAGVATSGQQAYCSRLPSTGTQLWSIYQGAVPSPDPTAAPAPTDVVYPAGIEEQVQACVSQTEKTRAECRNDIRDGNLTGPA
jgi:serine/threonine-protein kinase